MSKDKISFLIAAYNCEEIIELTLRHVVTIMNTFDSLNYEIIVVDDNSSDNTFNQLKELKKKFINLNIFKNEKNIGFSNTIFNALKFSSGEYIKLMHCADYKGTNLKEFILNYKNYDILLVDIIDKRNFFRKYLSKFCNQLFRIVSQRKIKYFSSAILCKKKLFEMYYPTKNFGTFFLPVIISKILIDNKSYTEIPVSPNQGSKNIKIKSKAINFNNLLSLFTALLEILTYRLKKNK